MANEQVRLQIRKNDTEHTWNDVGNKVGDESVPVNIDSLPLPTGAATSAKQDTLLTELQQKTEPTDTQPVSAVALPLPTGAATWVTTAVTLTTLNTAYLLPTTEQTGRKVIVIYNVSDTAVYLGTSSVTTTNGILLPAGGTMTLDSASGLYGICGTSGKVINILEGK